MRTGQIGPDLRLTLVLYMFMYSLIHSNKGRFSPFFFSRLKEYNFSIGMVLGAGRRNSQYTD